MRKALLVVLILSAAVAWAQGGCTGQKPLDGVTTGGFLKALSNQTIRVCTDTANPCTLAQIYSDAALTQAIDQTAHPLVSDAAGNYQYCAAPGTYNEQITSAGSVFAQVNNTPVTISGTNGVSQGGSFSYSSLTPATRSDQVFVFEGDSRTAVAGGGIPSGDEYPTQIMALPFFSGRGTAFNVGTGGDTCAGITSEYATEVAPHKPNGTTITKAYLFVMIGINDAMNGITAATTTTCIQNYWTTAKADGFTVVALTNFYGMQPGYTNGCNGGPCVAAEGVRLQVNDSIRASSIPDYIIDVDQLFPPAADFANSGANTWNPLYFNAVHLNRAGNRLIATYMNAVMSTPGASSIMRFGYPEKIWARSGEFHVLNGAIVAGDCSANSSQQKGDITTSRGTVNSCDSGVVWFGNDNSSFIQRAAGTSAFIWNMTAGLNLAGTAPKLSVGGVPSGTIANGDVWASRSATTGVVGLGTDGAGWLFRDSATDITTPGTFSFTAGTYKTGANCLSTVGTCGSASAGRVTIAAAATTVTVATTAVTTSSEIFVQNDSSLSAVLGVTCNTQSSLVLGTPRVTAKTGGTSFVITIDVAPTTNPLCLTYRIVN